MINVLKYSLVMGLLLVLVGGTALILARPSDVRADQAGRAVSAEREATEGRGGPYGAGGGLEDGEDGVTLGQGRGRWTTTDPGTKLDTGELGRGRGVGGAAAAPGTRGSQNDPIGQGRSAGVVAATDPDDWETIEGVVIVADSDLTVRTGSGDVLVGLGQQWYRDQEGFVIAVGDQVRVTGYYEDGEFKAGTVENLTQQSSITLRDATGRPMWSGRGNRQNQVSPEA